jgi:hypothetical protein
MSSVRMHALITGLALAVAGALLALSGGLFGSDLPKVALLGTAAGAVLGLVPDRSPGARSLAFVSGLLATWLGYALRAGFLPDTGTGRAIAYVIIVALVTAVAVISANRLPMWACFVGVAAMAGAYEVVFTATPTAFKGESMTAVTTAVLATAFCFVVSVFAGGTAGVVEAAAEEDHHHHTVPAPRAAADSTVPMTQNEATA